MKLELKSPTELLNKAYLKQPPARSELELFCSSLSNLLTHLQTGNREEHQKNHISDFLKEVWYRKTNLINTAGDIDLAIYDGLTSSTPVSVIIETKSSTNSAEMMSREKPNAKALHEIVLYYLREVFEKSNYGIKHLIVTNSLEWFVFDGVWFERNVRRNTGLVKAYKSFKAEGHDNRHFYESIARPWLEALEEPLPCCWFDLRTISTTLTTPSPLLERKAGALKSSPPILGGVGGGKVFGGKVRSDLIVLYKLLSPQHLLKLPVTNDSNSLNREFYGELLHIMGLEEVKEKGKKLIRRVSPDRRNEGALLENTINLLKVRQALDGVKNLSEYGTEAEEQYFSVALELCITWLNRILFLKLLEGRLIVWNPDEANHAFLNRQRIADFDELQELFFEVLARQVSERTKDVTIKFGDIPYLNSSLFEMTTLEKCALQISNLKQRLTVPLHTSTVLKNDAGKWRSGEQNSLHYLFEFLDSYDFASEGKNDVKEAPKTIINASVLGLIFEKINGYRDGSFYTPGYITMYMSREAIRRTVLQKFNERYFWSCTDFVELHNALGRVEIKEANEIVNSIKICDPAVGSGHFLVSALNEIVAIKADLKILTDKEGRLLRDYAITVENDELKVMDGNIPFVYRPANEESARVQETLFREKAAVIEGCLFGVDINPKSVAICRLRLWIELLKSAYYKPNTTTPNPLLERKEGALKSSPPILGGAGGGKVFGAGGKVLETLPNIDINIKCGNSLVSRFSLNDDKTGFSHYAPVERKRLKELTRRYKEKVWMYKLGEKGPSNKGILRREIEAIKEEWRSFSLPSDFYMKELFNLKNELTQAVFEFDEVGHQKREKLHQRATELEVMIAARQSTVYSNAFEWRFEFPEVLDEDGNFVGFDVVIGNPPYGNLASKELQQYFATNYQHQDNQKDLYLLFLERYSHLMKNKSLLGIIIPNTWLQSVTFKKIRQYMTNQYKWHNLLHLPENVFDAVVDTMVLVFEYSPDSVTPLLNVPIYLRRDGIVTLSHELPWANIPKNGDPINIVADKHMQKLAFKIITSVVLDDLCKTTQGTKPFQVGKGKPQQTRETVDLKEFVSTEKRDETYKPLLRGSLINKYRILWNDDYWISFGDWLAEPRYSASYDASEKIIIRQTGDSLVATLDTEQFIVRDNLYTVVMKDGQHIELKYILGLVNSSLLNWYYQTIMNPEKGEALAQVKRNHIAQLPIHVATPEQQTPIIELVDQILITKKADPKADTTELESSIDSLVYGLYGLDEEEQSMVEGTRKPYHPPTPPKIGGEL